MYFVSSEKLQNENTEEENSTISPKKILTGRVSIWEKIPLVCFHFVVSAFLYPKYPRLFISKKAQLHYNLDIITLAEILLLCSGFVFGFGVFFPPESAFKGCLQAKEPIFVQIYVHNSISLSQ